MQISVDIWALRDKMLRDDPNLFIDFWSSTRCLWNKLLANANQLLCRKYQRRFFFEEVTFDHVPGKEKDQVSPMFISEHQRRNSVCRFCKITRVQFFEGGVWGYEHCNITKQLYLCLSVTFKFYLQCSVWIFTDVARELISIFLLAAFFNVFNPFEKCNFIGT